MKKGRDEVTIRWLSLVGVLEQHVKKSPTRAFGIGFYVVTMWICLFSLVTGFREHSLMICYDIDTQA